jgi:hypothetical protein
MTLNSDAPPSENRTDTADRGEICANIFEQVNVRTGGTLTSRQAQALRGIEYFVANNGRVPRRREMLAMLEITSQRYLRKDLLGALEAKGYLRVVPNVAGGIVLLIHSSTAEIVDPKPAAARGPGLVKAAPRAASSRRAAG